MELDDDLGLEPATDNDQEEFSVPPFDVLRTNVKGYNGEIGLGGCTAFIGENKTGKSAKLDAIRLAITGKHPVGQYAKDLYGELAPDGAESLFAQLAGPGGLEAKYEIKTTKTGKPKKPEHEFGGELLRYKEACPENFEHVMPMVSMRDLLKGSSKTREVVFRRFGNITSVPEPAALSPEQKKLWQQLAKEIQEGKKPITDPVDQLTAIRLAADRLKRARNAEVKVLAEQITETKRAIAEAGGGELIPQLEEQKKIAEIWESKQSAREGYERDKQLLEQLQEEAKHLNELSTKLDQREELLEAEETEMQQTVAKLRGEHDAIDLTAVEKKLNRVVALIEILDAMAEKSVSVCPVCERDGVDAASKRDKFTGLRDQRMQAKQELTTKRSTLIREAEELETAVKRKRLHLQQERGQLNARKDTLRSRGASCKGRLDAYQEAGADEVYEGPASVEIIQQIQAIRELDAKRLRLTEDNTKVQEMKAESERAKTLQKEADELLQQLVVGVATAAEKAVNAYMPSGFEAKLDIEDGNCEWRILGGDQRAHGKSMCGSEKSALIIALASAWTEEAPVRYLSLDDEDVHGFSEKNMHVLCERLDELQKAGRFSQVFLATTRPGDIPASWVKVRT